jgi:hypothetical protein
MPTPLPAPCVSPAFPPLAAGGGQTVPKTEAGDQIVRAQPVGPLGE